VAPAAAVQSRPVKIDVHTHILPERWPDLVERYGYPGFVRLHHYAPGQARMMIGDAAFREIDDRCWSPQRRLADCDAAGVDVQVLSTVPVMFSYWARPADGYDLARLLNDHIAGVCREQPRRFVGLGTLPLQDPELAIRELERCVRPADRGGLGLAGAEIGTHVEPNEYTGRDRVWNLDEPALFPVFARAEQLGAAIFVHPWDMMGKERMPKYWLPWLVGMPAETCLAICSMIFGGVFERLPKLRVCFAHGGGSFAFSIGRIEHGFRVRPDLCAVDNPVNPRAYVSRPDGGTRGPDGMTGPQASQFWVDSLVHDADALLYLIRVMGPERVCLGSDYPFPLGEPTPGRLIASVGGLDGRVRDRLLWGSACEFLGDAAAPSLSAWAANGDGVVGRDRSG